MPFRMNGVEMTSVVVNGVAMDNVYVNGVLVFTAGWDLSGASYDSVSKLVNPPIPTPQEMFFKPDGTVVYITGSTNDTIYQFNLSTPWVASSIVIPAATSLSVATETQAPNSLFFDTTGTKLFVMSGSTPTGTLFQYNLNTAWNVGTKTGGVASKSLSAISPLVGGEGIFFKPDGTRCYVIDDFTVGNDAIYQYDLSTPWNVTTATYGSVSFNISSIESTPKSIQFSSSGLQMYYIGWATDTVYEHQLNTAWDLNTVVATPSASFLTTQGEALPSGISFKSDGSKFYIIGIGTDTVRQYSM